MRTLELFEQFGFAEEAVQAGADMNIFNMCNSRGMRGQIPLSVLKELDTPFPNFMGLPQVSHRPCCPDRNAAHLASPFAAEAAVAADVTFGTLPQRCHTPGCQAI